MPIRALCAVLLAAAVCAPAHAAAKLSVGIVPFDMATVDGASGASGEAIAKLVRIEMIKNPKLQPVLLPAPAEDSPIKLPLSGSGPRSDVVLVGTVLTADTSQSRHDANTGSLFGGNIGIGGRVNRVTTEVLLHIEIDNPKTGDVIDTFEVEAKSSGTSLGTDLSTALGSVDTGGSGFDNSSVGKAFREAAQKIAAEVAKRADTLLPH